MSLLSFLHFYILFTIEFFKLNSVVRKVLSWDLTMPMSDPQDSTVRVIWAYHHEDAGEAGPKYHDSNRGTKSLRLLNPEKTSVLSTALEYFDLVNQDVSVFRFYDYRDGLIQSVYEHFCLHYCIQAHVKRRWLCVFLPFLLRQVPIPNKDTTYWCQMFKIPVFQEKHHVIKVRDSFIG